MPSPAPLRQEDGGDVDATSSLSLEADLKLAAEIGVALLQEKSVLQQRVESLENANQKLLARLSSAVKENNQLQRVRAPHLELSRDGDTYTTRKHV